MSKAQQNQCPVPAGTLLIIGGNENKGGAETENRQTPAGFIPLEIHKRFLDLIREKENPVIEVITTASSEGAESFEEYKKMYAGLGINNISQIHHNTRKEILDNDCLERVRNADAFFLSGGDQLLLASIYGGTSFLTELKIRYIKDRIVIAGTSAGAMAMSTPMIYAGNEEVQEIGGEIKITTGLEFLKDVCIDTHFVHRGRFIRLAQVIATNATCVGFGIEEDTALIVTEGNKVEVLGSGTVVVVEGFDITSASIKDFSNSKPVSIRDLKVHILATGDLYELKLTNPPHY